MKTTFTQDLAICTVLAIGMFIFALKIGFLQ